MGEGRTMGTMDGTKLLVALSHQKRVGEGPWAE